MNRFKFLISLEEGTCTARASSRWLTDRDAADRKGLEVVQVSRFDEGVERLRRTPGEAIALIPHLHQLAGELTLDADFLLHKKLCKWVANPPLFLASGAGPANRCAILPTLRSLVGAQIASMTLVDADNTQAAARLAASGACGLCVTNAHGVERYGLKPVRRLKQIDVFWLAFSAKKGGG